MDDEKIQHEKISSANPWLGSYPANLTFFLICFYFTDWENGTSEFWQDVKTFTMVTYDSTDKNLIKHTCLEE